MKKTLTLLILIVVISSSLPAQLVKGINLVGPFNQALNETTISELKKLNAEWVCLLPEVTLNRVSLELEPPHNEDWTLSQAGCRELIRDCRKRNLKVLIKPHLVLSKKTSPLDKVKQKSDWRGNIDFKNEADWKLLEQRYLDFILSWVQLAEEEAVDAFFIGTELKSFVKKRPQFWNEVITKSNEVYAGPLSYSSNWDNYNNINFWHRLHFIGINSYFPVSNKSVPTISQTKSNWGPIKEALSNFASEHKKNILLTEYGYRNIEQAGKAPWLHVSQTNSSINDTSQYNLLSAFFETIWKEDYILGGLLWNWTQKTPPGGNTDFSIQNKPSEELVRDWYGRK